MWTGETAKETLDWCQYAGRWLYSCWDCLTGQTIFNLKKLISYLFIFHSSSGNLLQYFYCSGMWHSIIEKRVYFYVSPKCLRLKLEFYLEVNEMHVDHSSVSDVNFSINNHNTASASLFQSSVQHVKCIYIPKPTKRHSWQLQHRTHLGEERLRSRKECS